MEIRNEIKQKNEEKKEFVHRSLADVQRAKLSKLMENPEKPVQIPDFAGKKDKDYQAPSFVRNVMGSSAGAGSGEFHVYRHLRRKEYSRQKYMKALTESERLDQEFQDRLEENQRLAEEKTNKKREKRKKKKKNHKGKKPKLDDNQESEEELSEKSESESEEKVDEEETEKKIETEDPEVACGVNNKNEDPVTEEKVDECPNEEEAEKKSDKEDPIEVACADNKNENPAEEKVDNEEKETT